MLAIAGGILIALLVIGLLFFGIIVLNDPVGEKGCGWILIIAAAIILAFIFL